MKISSTKKIILEEFPSEVRSWLVKLIDPLNRFLEQVYFALVKGLTINDNLKAQVKDLNIQVGQSYPISFSWTLNERPTAVIVAQISDDSGAAVPVYAMEWKYVNGQVNLTFTGLNAANAYTIKALGMV